VVTQKQYPSNNGISIYTFCKWGLSSKVDSCNIVMTDIHLGIEIR